MRKTLVIFIVSTIIIMTGSFLVSDIKFLPEFLLVTGGVGYIYSIVCLIHLSAGDYKKPLTVLILSLMASNLSNAAERHIHFGAGIFIVLLSGAGLVYALWLFIRTHKRIKNRDNVSQGKDESG